MNPDCKQFRLRLRAALEGGLRGESSSRESMRPLAWHEHLFTCDQCRSLLEAEEALEEVLASLPAPRIPRALAQRVLDRLTLERASENPDLDLLLTEADGVDVPNGLSSWVLTGLAAQREAALEGDLDFMLNLLPEPSVPETLVGHVLLAVEAEREANLDALLSLVPAPEIPAQLGARILDSLDAERMQEPSPILRPRFGALRYVTAIAATLVVAFGAWRMTVDGDSAGTAGINERDGMASNRTTNPRSENLASVDGITEPSRLTNPTEQDPTAPINVAAREQLPDPSVLASLDVLEDWELLISDDIDLLLGSLDEADAELLFLITEDDEETTEEG